MSRAFDAMIAGHVCFDVIPRFPEEVKPSIGDLFRPGKLVTVNEAMMSTGGPVANTGISMKTLGNKICFCAGIGDDNFGKLALEYLRKKGNAEGILVMQGTTSSYTIVIAPPNIDRIFFHHPGSNHYFGPENLDPGLLEQCRLFHFGYPPLMRRMYEGKGKELEQVFKLAKNSGLTTSCDMALPDPDSDSGSADWRAILARVLPYVDIFLPSVEEALYLLEPKKFIAMKERHGNQELIDFFSPEDYSNIAARALKFGSRMVGLKSGHHGFYLRSASGEALAALGAAKPKNLANWTERELWCPAFSAARVASATGAGDSSIAGFLTALLRGATVEKSLKIANCLGWQNLQELDAVSGIRSWEETLALLKKGLPIHELKISSAGWKWHPDLTLWSGPGDRLLGSGGKHGSGRKQSKCVF